MLANMCEDCFASDIIGDLKGTKEFKASGRQRPARLYTFTEPKVIKLQEKGIIVPF